MQTMSEPWAQEARDNLKEFRLMFDGGDPWGSTMHWWFTVADELYHREGYTPEHWQFKPSPLGPSNDPDDYATTACAETGANALVFVGNVLTRYARRLERAGLSY